MKFYNFLRLLVFIQKFTGPFIEALGNCFLSIKTRIDFENKNEYDPFSRSFKDDNIKATYCFEVSSDGEFQQIKPLIDKCLRDNLRVELIYSSPSLEGKFCEYNDKNLIRILRYPLLTNPGFVIDWITSDKLVFCRYDFFPDLLMKTFDRNIKSILVWATLKDKINHLNGSGLKSYFYNHVFSIFNTIVFPIKSELKEFQKINNKAEFYNIELRSLIINRRVDSSVDVLNQKFKSFDKIREKLNKYDKCNRLILGSAWQVDLLILNEHIIQLIKDKKILLAIVPHDLSKKNLDLIRGKLEFKLKEEVSIYNLENLCNLKENIFILNAKGVLCELYSFFGHAYVGGGFGRSVHSLLEPYFAKCLVYCGPKVHRSTEYDLIKELNPERIKISQNNFNLMEYSELDTKVVNKLFLDAENFINNFNAGLKY